MKGRRILVMLGMGLILTGVLLGGLFFLVRNSQTAISSMSYKKYSDWTGNEGNTIGKVLDANGKLLWSVDFAGYEDTYSIIGNPECVLNENTVAVRLQSELFGCSDYSIWEGVDSLEDTGRDICVTLDHERNSDIYYYMKENGVKKGSALVMDASTGAIKVCVSLPAADPSDDVEEMADGALLNRNFATTISGSTLKTVVTLLLLEQGETVENEIYICNGSHTLEDGTSVTCITKQGSHDLTSALGVSCNAYYAYMINKYLDTNGNEVAKRLEELGFVVGTKEDRETASLDASGITFKKSLVNYKGDGGFTSTWALIGEGDVQVSPVQMARIVSAMVHGGEAAEPYLLESVGNGESAESYQLESVGNGADAGAHAVVKEQLIEKETADKMYQIWKEAFEEYYSDEEYSGKITVAKTGTAEYDGGKSSKLLVGYLEERDEVFFIEICDYDGGLKPADVANYISVK